MNPSRRFSRILAPAALIGLVCLSAAILLWSSPEGKANLTEHIRSVATQLRCPVCHGESVYDSPSALAGNMRSKIRSLLRSGETESQVKEYFVSRYGEWILLAPPASGIGLLVWVGPLLLLAVGVGLLAVSGMGWLRSRSPVQNASDVHGGEDGEAVLVSLSTRADQGELSTADVEAARRELFSSRAETAAATTGRTSHSLQFLALVAGGIAIASIISLINPATAPMPSQAAQRASALTSAKLLVRTHPRSARDWAILGQVELNLGLAHRAAQSYSRAHHLSPTSHSIAFDLSYILIGLRRPAEALTVLRSLPPKVAGAPQAWLLKGMAYRRMGRKRQALTDLREFVHLEPHNVVAPAVRGWIRALQG